MLNICCSEITNALIVSGLICVLKLLKVFSKKILLGTAENDCVVLLKNSTSDPFRSPALS